MLPPADGWLDGQAGPPPRRRGHGAAVDDALTLLHLAALALSTLLVILGPPLIMLVRQRCSVAALALWVASLVLLGVWVKVSYDGGVRADETQTVGDIFDGLEWLLDTVVVSAGAAVVAATVTVRRRRS